MPPENGDELLSAYAVAVPGSSKQIPEPFHFLRGNPEGHGSASSPGVADSFKGYGRLAFFPVAAVAGDDIIRSVHRRRLSFSCAYLQNLRIVHVLLGKPNFFSGVGLRADLKTYLCQTVSGYPVGKISSFFAKAEPLNLSHALYPIPDH